MARMSLDNSAGGSIYISETIEEAHELIETVVMNQHLYSGDETSIKEEVKAVSAESDARKQDAPLTQQLHALAQQLLELQEALRETQASNKNFRKSKTHTLSEIFVPPKLTLSLHLNPFQKPCHHRRNPSNLTIAKKPSRYRNPLTHHSPLLLFTLLLIAAPPSPSSSLHFSSSFPFQFDRVTLISALYTELNEYFFFDSSPIHATCTNSRAISFDSSPLLISSSRVFTFDLSSLISSSPLPFITALTNVKKTVCSLATSSLLYCEASRFLMRQSIDPLQASTLLQFLSCCLTQLAQAEWILCLSVFFLLCFLFFCPFHFLVEEELDFPKNEGSLSGSINILSPAGCCIGLLFFLLFLR
ncbi:uncharacterized protein LOC107615723 [Arachis ipaensis]|uniref:uncharacterized protein LOC107615723 n=1 Tax=Arachis ipaensis TaxID=130454 RepID=UPI0007AF5F39|nr:uncharacterized protein LOC107615723 [Arachis ipaensis]